LIVNTVCVYTILNKYEYQPLVYVFSACPDCNVAGRNLKLDFVSLPSPSLASSCDSAGL